MNFVLRILFSGLIAFVPSEDGQEVTVLLLKADHANHLSDGSALPDHTSVLIARAGDCSGQCPTEDTEMAQLMFIDKSPSVALASLQEAISGGAAWFLSGSDLTIDKGSTSDPDLPDLVIRDDVRGTVNGVPQSIPTTATEREDFSWIADLQQICPSACTLNEDVFDEEPPAGLVAARLKVRNGTMYTYSVARIGSEVTPVHFKRLDGTGNASSYSQAIASWVGVDIEVSGDSIEIVEEKFDGGAGRSMILEPDTSGKVEIAVLNLPPFVPPASANNAAPQVGKHFEIYYELSQTPPDVETRLVPKAGAAASAPSYPEVDWQDIHPTTSVWSVLLNKLRLDVGRSVYDRTLCPPVNP